ncbi:hypothetical protein MDA_GLEAN10005230 [Myotis davidii]|uniref:Uncharacterized protein n=1 Tax=Myotis davidii TaxID=225400 RepID=L5M0Y1_MYODS|nr:hypothetical protein MDA_GLEAN10005230 [Myotis davidii]
MQPGEQARAVLADPTLRLSAPRRRQQQQQQRRVHELSSGTQTPIFYQENSPLRFSRDVGGGSRDGRINSNRFHASGLNN